MSATKDNMLYIKVSFLLYLKMEYCNVLSGQVVPERGETQVELVL